MSVNSVSQNGRMDQLTHSLARKAEERHPALNGRAVRAAQIVVSGGVRIENGSYSVDSQSNGKPYQVVNVNGQVKCTCKDWIRGKRGMSPGAPTIAGQVVCKHILAVKIAGRLDVHLWPPLCPDCGRDMNVRRDDEGIPFWSCAGFSHTCRGRTPFVAHPDDRDVYASLERVKRAGLMAPLPSSVQRRVHQRNVAQAYVDIHRAMDTCPGQ
jgi:ribosomal protein L37AE/L43A